MGMSIQHQTASIPARGQRHVLMARLMLKIAIKFQKDGGWA